MIEKGNEPGEQLADAFLHSTGADIREGHGDLHAANVCVLEAPDPTSGLAAGIYVFDCVEFSHAFRCNDVASEIAFLAMEIRVHPRTCWLFILLRRFVGASPVAFGVPPKSG